MRKSFVEMSFLLPEYDPEGDDVHEMHEEVEAELLKEFDTITSEYTQHIHISEEGDLCNDDMLRYTVLIENTASLEEDVASVVGIAKTFGAHMGQDTVHIKYPKGNVEYVETNFKAESVKTQSASASR